ncbi:MAG: helix-turn-helix domain-containing protein [Coriobacteriales bacterium]|jgi:transcriptional regulator with XRE-family HTH domain|nr:helix-turn-helix domain-containing protein [Coriobacteriales bacterium]
MASISEIESRLGAAIRQIRIREGLPLEELAAKANLSPTTLRSLELGRGSTLSTLVKTLRAFDRLDVLESLIAAGEAFSPIEVLRQERGLAKKPQRAPRQSRPKATGTPKVSQGPSSNRKTNKAKAGERP